MRKTLTPEQAAYLEQLTIEWNDALIRYAYRFTGYQERLRPDIEDAVQTTLLKAVLEVDVLLQHSNPAGWLKKCLLFNLLNMKRSMDNKPVIPVAEVRENDHLMFGTTPSAFEASSNSPSLSDVLELADRILNSAEKETFRDYFLDDCTMSETARLEHETAATIRGRISRIRQKLKRYLG